jgi:O-antigen/teichoic acid export membrane protein
LTSTLARPGESQSPGPPAKGELGEIARASSLNLVGAALSAVATLGVTIVVTRYYSRPVAGAFFAATSLFLIIEAVSNLGAYNGIIYFIARRRSARSLRDVAPIIRSAVLPVAVVSVLAATALVVFAEPAARLLLGGHLSHGVGPAPVARALRALAVAIPFAALLDTFLGASRGYRNMKPTVVADRIGRSGLQLLGVLAAAVAGSAGLLAPLWALPYIPAGVVACMWFRRTARRNPAPGRRDPADQPPAHPGHAHEARAHPGHARGAHTGRGHPDQRAGGLLRGGAADGPRQRPEAAYAAGFWRFTAPRALASVAQMTIQRLDIVLVGVMKGPVEAAVYPAATRFLVVGQLGNAAISMASQPQFTHLFAINDRRGANLVYQATTAWLIVLTWPLYLLAAIYGPEVLSIFGHSYRAGASVMVILGLTMLLATGCGQVDMVLTTTGRTSWSLANGLLAVAINVALDVALIPRYGITGAAIGWAAAIAATNLLPLAQLASVVRIHPFGRGTLTACVLTTVSFGVIPLGLRWLAPGAGGKAGALAVLAGCLLLAAGLWRFRAPLQLAAMPIRLPAQVLRRHPGRGGRPRGQHRRRLSDTRPPPP